MNNDRLAQFANQKYLSLESYRRNGQGVRTPLWFVEDNGVLYFYTVADSYKVKRIDANPRVRVAPCDMRGKVKGEWVDATARRIIGEESRRANELLNRKYGLAKRIINFLSKIQGRERASFAIQLN
jgi:PPOX class probable F420-dependent enzyme